MITVKTEITGFISNDNTRTLKLKMAAHTARTDTSYAAKASHGFPSAKPAEQFGGKPVFLKNKDIPSVSEKGMSNQDMYKCLIGCVQGREIKGIQKIGGLWRLYVETQDTRIKLITNGLNVRNANVAIYDQNPFFSDGRENSLRLLIRDVPLSVHESLIIDELEKLKHKVNGPAIYQRLRVDGQLTDCLTGNRIVYIEQPSKPLPRDMNFGIFKAKVYHFGQPDPSPRSTVMCSRCLKAGHHRSQCSSPVVCRRCKQSGHLQQECTVETPPTSPTRGASGYAPTPAPPAYPSASASTTTPPVQTIEQLISSGRQAAAAGSASAHQSLHDSQTRTQPKITQYLVGDRDASHASQPRQPVDNTNAEISTPVRTDAVTQQSAGSSKTIDTPAHSDTSSEELSSEDDSVGVVSEISVESPELPKHPVKESKVKQTKRKQKSSKKLPKKK